MAPVGIDWLLVGLGNPGPEYAGTRHNAGFMAIDAFTRAVKGSMRDRKPWGVSGEARLAGKRVGMLKPATFMNLSGEAVAAYMRSRPVDAERVAVLHDDMDLELGRIMVKMGGGDGGHKGLQSIAGKIGPAFLRIRMGIGRPPAGMDGAEYVLEPFSEGEAETAAAMAARASEAARTLIAEGPVRAMNTINRVDRNPCSAADAGPERPEGERR
jgi:PTH1 family peptidyl-tRNA hydrolase